MHKKCLVRLVGLLLAVCFIFQTGFIWISYADDSSKDDRQKIIVSLGDSYASGEGIPPFYGWDKVQDWSFSKPTDWLAHRSKNSWPGMLTLPCVGKMSENLDHWYFAAASGATTEHLLGKQEKHVNNSSLDYLINLNPVVKLGGYYKYELDPQLDVFKILKARGQKADYVTVSIGGNDMQFANVMIQAALMGGYSGFFFLQMKIDSIWKTYETETKYRITKAYRDIREHAGDQAVIIVVGYPGLLNVKGDKTFFNETEAQYIDFQVQKFNGELQKIVQSLQKEDKKIRYVSVMSDFFGHEAYTNDPYLNGIIMPARSDDLDNQSISSSYSLHPNKKGAEIYADCVQDIIDQTEGDWSNAYRRFVYREKYLKNPDDKYGSDANCVNFGLHDFDGNGIPELVIGNGVDAHMSAGCHVYTYRDDGICYLGQILSWPGSNESGEGLFYYDDAIYTGLFWEEEFQSSLCRNYYYLDDFGELKTELVETGSYDEEWSRDSYKVEQRTSDDTLFILGRDPARISFVMFSYSDIFENGWDLFVRFYESIETELMSHQDEQENEETLSGWKKIYQDFIQNETYEQFRQYGDELWFALHDLDGDGTPELIYTDGGEWYEYDYIVCTIRSGGVVCIGKMCAPLGAWFDEGFPFLYSEDDRYPGLFSKNNIYGYYGNESDRYCGYFEIGSGGTIAEQVVEASIGDRTLKETDEDLLFRLGIYGDLHPLRFYEVSTLMDDGWGTFWSYWYQPEDHAEFDIWHAVEKSNVLDYISMTYDEVCGLAGQLEMINVEMDSPRHYLFRFAGLSDMELSFETDLSEAEEYMDEYGRIPASVASQYIDGTERCDGILVYSVNAFGGSDFNAADIGAEIFEFMPDTGLWLAHAEHAGCDFYFVCEDSDGSISDRCAVWIVGNLPSQEEQIPNVQKNGWINEGRSSETWTEGDWFYYLSGQPVTGWQSIGGETYFFFNNGKMAEGLTTINGALYYFVEHNYGGGPSTGNRPEHGALSNGGFEQRSDGSMVFCDLNGRVITYDGEGDSRYFEYATAGFSLVWNEDQLAYERTAADYGYYDIDKDGIKEFYIKRGTGEPNYSFEFYTPDSSEQRYNRIGTIDGAYSKLVWEGDSLYLVNQQTNTKQVIRIKNGIIELEATGSSQQPATESKASLTEKLLSNSLAKEIGMTYGELNAKYGPLDYVYLAPEEPIQAVFKNSKGSISYFFNGVADSIPNELWDESIANNGIISPNSAGKLIFDSDTCTGVYATFRTFGISDPNDYETWFTENNFYHDELWDMYHYTTSSGRYDLSTESETANTSLNGDDWLEITLKRGYWPDRIIPTQEESKLTSKWHYDPYAALASAENILNTIEGKGATYVSKLLREGGLTKVKQSGAGDLIDYLNNAKNWDGERIGTVVTDPAYSELHVGDVLCSVCSKGSKASDYTNGHGKGTNLYHGIQVFFVSEIGADYVCVYSKNNDRHNEVMRISCNGGNIIDKCGRCGNSDNVHWIAFCFSDEIKQ